MHAPASPDWTHAARPTLTQGHAPVRHPLGSDARILLASVFGPYAADDEHGSRAINPMELYHNQVTRVQGVFSLRMFHRSWGLMLMQANVGAPCTLLDFATRDRFIDELRTKRYDIVGIGGIQPNLAKVQHMCGLVRQHQPAATILVGGHVANAPAIASRVDADFVVRGEGVRWLRSFLGEDPVAPVYHPRVLSAHGTRTVGLGLSASPRHTAAVLIPSVGCPLGCSFCATSAFFGGKGHLVAFYQSAEELFEVMCDLERDMHVSSFFVMDENFLLERRRALRLLDLMRRGRKSWSLYVFSSANALRRFQMSELVELGISWVWLGLEGEGSSYAKLKGADTRALVRELQSHGIRVLGSSIIGLPEHTPSTMDAVIAHAVAHDTEFHQFMLYTPVAGTPLHVEHLASGTLIDEDDCPIADTHGQYRFNHRHPHIRDGQEAALLLQAFQEDFDRNGPSITRVARTLLTGWQRYHAHPDARVRQRVARESEALPTAYAGLLWAAERWLSGNAPVAARLRALRAELAHAFGLKARVAAPLVGTVVLAAMRRELARLRRGWTYEPPTFYEQNAAARALTR